MTSGVATDKIGPDFRVLCVLCDGIRQMVSPRIRPVILDSLKGSSQVS